MSDKKSFVIRIDNETYKALEKWAADEFRSVNGQIEWILSQKLKETGRTKEGNSKTPRSKKWSAIPGFDPGFQMESVMWKKRFLCGYFLFIPLPARANLVLSIITMYRVQKGQNTLTWAPNIEHYD